MRNYQTKSNQGALPDSITSTRFGAGEFNSVAVELEGAVTTSGQTLAPADGTGEVTDQLAMALAIYGAGGATYHVDTGAVNAYVLAPVSPKESPNALFNGFSVVFEPGTVNTTASTVNVGGLGVKSVTLQNGTALSGGEISGTCCLKYNLSDDRFELIYSSDSALKISQYYEIDATQADQGATSTNSETMTIYDVATLVGTSKFATIHLSHNPAAGNQTYYTFDTSLDLSLYPFLFVEPDVGAHFTRTTGDEVFTINKPENIKAKSNQKITSVDMIAFAQPGVAYADWWGAVPDSSTESIDAINYALGSVSGVVVQMLAGVYVGTDKTITIPSNATLKGQGNGNDSTVIRALSLSATTPLLINENAGSFSDIDISIEGITFDGQGAGAGASQTRLTEMISFGKATDVTIKNCRIKNVQYIGMAFGACINVVISDCEFYSCGYDGTTTNAGPALWFGAIGADTPLNIRVENSHFHDNYWHGITFQGIGGSISGCHFEDNQEAHIFAPSAYNYEITGNTFIGIRKHDISAHAMELGSRRFSITGNTIYDCDHGGIALTDCQNGVISGNSIGNFAKLLTSHTGIDIYSTSAGPDQPKNLSISGNTIFDDQASPTGYGAIQITGFGSGVACENIIITGNSVNCSAGWVSGSAIIKNGTYWNSTDFHKNNAGSADITTVTGSLTLTAATGNVSVTGLPFTPHRIEFRGIYNSAGGIYISHGEVSYGVGVVCLTYIADSGGYVNVASTSHVLDIWLAPATPFMTVDFVSFDFDGFTINKTVATYAATLYWTAFP